MKIDLRSYRNEHGFGNKVARFAWDLVWLTLFRPTPRWVVFSRWRIMLLRLFGAKVAWSVKILPSCRIWQPWHLTIGENSWIDRDVNLYSVDDIRIGHDAVVSEGAYVCTASHDITCETFALTTAPVEIGDCAWVCAHAIVLPRVKVGEGAVVAAGAVTTKDVEPWTVVGGVPAKVIKKRSEVRGRRSEGEGQKLRDLLTIVIPVRNEEKNLPVCLESVKEFEHVVLVDSGSSDATRQIFDEMALRRGGTPRPTGWERVDFKWDGKFPKKRNWLLRNYAFKTPWVLFLDADERMTEAWKHEATAVLASKASERCDVIWCNYDNWFMGRMLRHGDPMKKTAMVRVGAAEYEKIDEDNWSSLDMEIHEHLQARRENAEGEIHARMEHYDKRGFESHVSKHCEYAKWEANRYHQLMEHPERWDALSPRQKMKYRNITKWWLSHGYFFVSYICKLGFLDGYAGFRFALFKTWYFALVRKEISHSRES